MLELIITCFSFWLGYQLGLFVMSYRLRDLIYKEAKRRGLTDNVEDKPLVLQLETQKSNDTLYLYEKGTNNFICQGITLDELAKLALQYKNIKYASVISEGDVFAFVNGNVKPAKEILK